MDAMSCLWATVCDAGSTVSCHWMGISCVRIILQRHAAPGQYISLPIIEWMLASPGAGGPVLNRHLVSIVL